MYLFNLAVRVQISDINYGGHVSNSKILDYFHEARLQFLQSLGPYSEMDIGDKTGLILVESNIKYLSEMFHLDMISINVSVSNIKRSSFSINYDVFRNGTKTVEGSTTMVAFDYQKRSVRRLPKIFKEIIEDF